MSRGLGRVERWIAEDIAYRKSLRGCHCVLVSVWDLIHAFPDADDDDWDFPSKAQRKSVVRAMHSFVRKFPQYALMGGQGRKQLYLYELADPDSVAWAQTSVATEGFVAFNQRKRVALVEKKIPRIGVLEKKIPHPRLH